MSSDRFGQKLRPCRRAYIKSRYDFDQIGQLQNQKVGYRSVLNQKVDKLRGVTKLDTVVFLIKKLTSEHICPNPYIPSTVRRVVAI